MIQYIATSITAPLASPTGRPSSNLPSLDNREIAREVRVAAASPTAPPAHAQVQHRDLKSSGYAHIDLDSALGNLVIPQSISSCTNTTLARATASVDCVVQSKLPV